MLHLKLQNRVDQNFINDFGKLQLTSDMEHKAETFLANAIGGFEVDTMDKIRCFQYNRKALKTTS